MLAIAFSQNENQAPAQHYWNVMLMRVPPHRPIIADDERRAAGQTDPESTVPPQPNRISGGNGIRLL